MEKNSSDILIMQILQGNLPGRTDINHKEFGQYQISIWTWNVSQTENATTFGVVFQAPVISWWRIWTPGIWECLNKSQRTRNQRTKNNVLGMHKQAALLKNQTFLWAKLWPQFGLKECTWGEWDTKRRVSYLTETALRRKIFFLKDHSS